MIINVKLFRRLRARGLSIRQAQRIANTGVDPKPSWNKRNPEKYRQRMRKYMAERRESVRSVRAALVANAAFQRNTQFNRRRGPKG